MQLPNSMKRSVTYIPSNDAAAGRTGHLTSSPQRSASLAHRRSQSATFLTVQNFSKLNQIKENPKSDFAKTKKTLFDTEVSIYLLKMVKIKSHLRDDKFTDLEDKIWTFQSKFSLMCV